MIRQILNNVVYRILHILGSTCSVRFEEAEVLPEIRYESRKGKYDYNIDEMRG